MTEYILNQSIIKNTDFLKTALRNEKDTLLNSVKSFRGQLADGIKTLGKKWLKTQEYNIGDIVVLNQIVYICKVSNYNKNPIINRYYWQLYKLPFTQNEGKVKAYVLFKTDLTIIESYNVTSITEYTNMRYLINLTTDLGSEANILTSLIETDIDSKYITGTYLASSNQISLRCWGANETGLLTINDNNNIYICLIVYSTSNILH